MREQGEMRVLKMLISGRYELATARLRCSGAAVVPLLDGTDRELIEINVEIDVGETEPVYSAIWTDDQGNVVRTYSPALNMIAYRTDQATATAVPNDDLFPLSVTVKGSMDRPQDTKRVAYRIKQLGSVDGETSVLLLPGPGQFVRGTPEGETQVLVSRQEEQPSGGFISDQPSPVPEDRRPNFFIDSQSELVKKFAGAAIGERKLSKLEVALELTGTANRMVNAEPERCGLAKASDVARVAEGDSTQSAILLAALLRAQKIPSRIAIGLRFEPGSVNGEDLPQMVGHVWTIAYIDDRWIHLDATEGDEAAADRLLLTTTNLSEDNENDPLSGVLRDAGRMEIEILTAKY
jgi:transglutaminase-like putative cysteine protease